MSLSSRRFARYVVLVLFSLLMCLPVAAQQRYSVTDFSAQNFDPWGINDNGQLVGAVYKPNGKFHASVWDSVNGERDIGTPVWGDGKNSVGMRINNSGQVLVRTEESNADHTNLIYRYFVWSSQAGMRELDLSGAIGVNNSGVFAGYILLTDGVSVESAIWEEPNAARRIGSFGERSSVAYDINDIGQVVGIGERKNTANEYYRIHTYTWDASNGMREIVGLGGSQSEIAGVSINNSGQVIGWSTSSDWSQHAFIYDNTNGIHDLHPLGSIWSAANDINEKGQVVGYSVKSEGGQVALLWSANGMHDLNNLVSSTLVAELLDARAINNVGQILCYGFNSSGEPQHFLLTPEPEEPLIFVPGIAGSHLVDKNPGYLQSSDLWLGAFSNHNRLTLDPREQQSDVIATDVIRETTVPPTTVYKPLLDMLNDGGRGGFTEYKVDGKPERRTESGCDYEVQKGDNPNLFVFAYDWRVSAGVNAGKLREYVKCVQMFHPDKKVNILAHSMGGLIARRYILQQPTDHNVNRLITINTPWLGAPKAINVMETGDFYPVTPLVLFSSTLKQLAEFFPGMHQLLPSRQYYNVSQYYDHLPATIPFTEHGWDINENGIAYENYDFGKQVGLLNMRHPHPQSLPGLAGENFHDTAGQDDWSGDTSGVEYHSIISTQNNDQTIGEVRAWRGEECFGDVMYPGGLFVRCSITNEFQTVMTAGDKTVPLVSLERGWSYNLQLRWNSTMHFFHSPNADVDGQYEHTKITEMSEVHDRILYLLGLKPAPPGGLTEIYPEIYHSMLPRAKFDSKRYSPNAQVFHQTLISHDFIAGVVSEPLAQPKQEVIHDRSTRVLTNTADVRSRSVRDSLFSIESEDVFGQLDTEMRADKFSGWDYHRGSRSFLDGAKIPIPREVRTMGFGLRSRIIANILSSGSDSGRGARTGHRASHNHDSPLAGRLTEQVKDQDFQRVIDTEMRVRGTDLRGNTAGRHHVRGQSEDTIAKRRHGIMVSGFGSRGVLDICCPRGNSRRGAGFASRAGYDFHTPLTESSEQLGQPMQEATHGTDTEMRSHRFSLRSGRSSRGGLSDGTEGVFSGGQSRLMEPAGGSRCVLCVHNLRSGGRRFSRAAYLLDNQLHSPVIHQQDAPKFVKASFTPDTNKPTARAASPAMTQQSTAPAYGPARRPTQPSYYVTIRGVTFVSVTDAAGNTNTPIDDTFMRQVPNVAYNLLGEKTVMISTPVRGAYTLTFQVGNNPIGVEIIKGVNNVTPTAITRYRDKALPAGVTVQLIVNAQGVSGLRYDADGDGSFETTIAPTVQVAGAAASDVTPPRVEITATPQPQVAGQPPQILITITASDTGSGVKGIVHSLDGMEFRPYTAPFTVDPTQISLIHAFADDNLANRSSLVTKRIGNNVVLAPVADAYVKGSTPDVNFGAALDLQVKRTLNPGTSKGRQAYLRFDTSSVTGTPARRAARVRQLDRDGRSKP